MRADSMARILPEFLRILQRYVKQARRGRSEDSESVRRGWIGGWMMKRWFLILAFLLPALLWREDSVAVTGGAVLEESRYVALTFDDGPKRGSTDRLLDGLRERGVNATFFLIGKQIEENQDLVARMADEGHQIGNHTWSHQRLDQGDDIQEELHRTEAVLEELCGPGPYWLRPPYGQVDENSVIGVPMVKWSVDPRDWESRDAAQVTQAILDNVQPNSIILLHDIYPSSVDAALQVVDTLQAQGYHFVTVAELLALNGVEPQPGKLYRTGRG